MLLKREGVVIDCHPDSTIARMFDMVLGDCVSITFTNADGSTVHWERA